MKISIVTACLNAEQYIEETLLSVLSQRGDFEIEYIVVDGGSTDHTAEIVKDIFSAYESGRSAISCRKITTGFFSEKDEGLYDALSKGFARLTGDVAGYINADDLYIPRAFSTVASVFETYPEVRWLTGMPVCYNADGQIIDTFLPVGYPGRLIRKGIFGKMLPHIQQESTFWRPKLLGHVDMGALKEFRLAGDFFLWRSFSLQTDLYVVRSCLSGYRTRPGQLTGQMHAYEREFDLIAEKMSWLDALQGKILKKAHDLLPDKYKRKINRRLIVFKDGMWRKRS
ncbi:Glycosyltransferase involved in cell wall biogenesis-like protein [Syntrophobacter sp. SbD1]|nr:Glycosyltransferase involved in cell wall biogenesis-like protein [Syntrophobacter sp. SbD1]